MSGIGDYISREAALKLLCKAACNVPNCECDRVRCPEWFAVHDAPAADVRPVVVCADCEYNNHCLTQEFVDDCGKIPLDRNTFFCADGERRSNA